MAAIAGGAGGTTRVPAGELAARLPGATAGAVIDGRLVVGGSDARVGLVALPGGEVLHAGPSPVGPVARVTRGPGGDAIVAGADGVGLWRPELGAWRHVAGGGGARGGDVAGERVIVFGGGTLSAWERTAGERTHRLHAGTGLGAIAWAPDGARVAFGGGGGAVQVLDVDDGRVRRTAVTDQVVKSLAFTAGGRSLAVGVATGAGLRLLDAVELREQRGPWLDPELSVRRLGLLPEDVLLAFNYGVPRGRSPCGAVPRARSPP